MDPVLIIGAGPIGLTTALGLAFYGIPFLLFEEDGTLSSDTKAGTILTRTIEVFRRYGVADQVLQQSLRIEEIGDIDRRTNERRRSVRTEELIDETRYPFVVNLPQHHLEPILGAALAPGATLMGHRFLSFTNTDQGVDARFQTADGIKTYSGSYLLGCDGGRSTVRGLCGIRTEGQSLEVRYMLMDIEVDLDIGNPRDYPYLAYFSDAEEWMILIRQPHCWRFLFPIAPDVEEPSDNELQAKILHFVGQVDTARKLGRVTYKVHHRIASQWRQDRVFLMGDAAHLITPMWALGLNTGILDASNLPWRLAWVLRGWADPALLDGYERELRSVAVEGAGRMAEAARGHMEMRAPEETGLSDHDWGNAYTRTLLGVRLDMSGDGDWAMVRPESAPQPLRVGDRMPDFPLQGPDGRPLRLHDLNGDCFVALYFADLRRRPPIPVDTSPALRHFVVSRWDAPLDSGLRDRALFDVANRLRDRVGAGDCMILIRPDDHIAAIVPLDQADASAAYQAVIGRAPPLEQPQ